MQIKTAYVLLGGLLLSLVCPIVVLLQPNLGVALVLVSFLPGWALVEGLFCLSPNRPGLGTRLVLGFGCAYVISIVGGLWLYYGLGRLTLPAMLLLYAVVGVVGFGVALWRTPASSEIRFDRGRLISLSSGLLVVLLLFAAYYRFYFLQYSDFRGDEAEVVLRAVASIRGQGQPILSHTKGPAETLLAAAFGLVYGAFDELAVRLPFALANWLAVLATYLLGRKMFGTRAGLLAGALVAVNGWFVTYGRTAQYQNLVLPLSILAVWAYYLYYKGGSRIYLALGTCFIAVATFGHYEGAAAAPALLYLLILGLKRRGVWRRRAWSELVPVGLSLLPGLVVVLSFYAPFMLNPTVAGAQKHVAKRFGEGLLYNNWDAFYVNGLFYNSIYFVLGAGAVLLLGTLYGVRSVINGERRGWLVALAVIPLLALCWTSLLPAWYALLVFVGLMALFLLSSRVSVAVKTLLWWMLLPFGLYLFAVVRPGNHYYVFMPSLMLLAALTLDRGLDWLHESRPAIRRWALPAVVGVLIIFYVLSAWYVHVVFMRTDLEYMLTYPENRNPVFWSDSRYPFDIRIGWGFPYRLGWQTVSELYRSGRLQGDWYSNDDNNSIYWYTLGWPRNPCYPRYFMQTDVGYQDPPLEIPEETIQAHYVLRANVNVNGRQRLRLYEFSPLGDDRPPDVYDEPMVYSTPYRVDTLTSDPLGEPTLRPSVALAPGTRFKPHPDVLAQLAEVYQDPRIVQVQDEVSLFGYDVDDTWAVPGGVILLTLYWQTDSGLIFPYKVFAHLGGERTWAQADDEPACGQSPTREWRPGDRVMDRHAIFLPADLPPGQYPLEVGLYEVRTGLRMDVLDELGNPAGNQLILPPVTIRAL